MPRTAQIQSGDSSKAAKELFSEDDIKREWSAICRVVLFFDSPALARSADVSSENLASCLRNSVAIAPKLHAKHCSFM